MTDLRKPDTRIYYLWNLEIVLLTLFLGAGTLFFVDVAWALTVSGAVLLLGLPYTYLRFRAWGFELRDDHLYLEHGVLKKVRSMVPHVRIQHVDTQRGPVARILGISNVVVYTAGSRGRDVIIPGLLREDAGDMQEKLRDVAIESGSSDAV